MMSKLHFNLTILRLILFFYYYFFFVLFIFILLIYFWLHWVFVAARRLSLVAATGGYFSQSHLPRTLPGVRYEPHSRRTKSFSFPMSVKGITSLHSLPMEDNSLSYSLGHLIMTLIGHLPNDFNKFRILLSVLLKKIL